MPTRALRVYANPYAFLDPEGRPAGVYSHDPKYFPGQMHVGVDRLKLREIEKRDPSEGRSSLADLVHIYDAEVQEVPFAPGDRHYVDGIRSGDLIAADEATARAAGVAFADPMAALDAARAKAIEAWTANHGEPPAFAVDDAAHAHVPAGLRGAAATDDNGAAPRSTASRARANAEKGDS
jgi:hypothetical protein